MMPAGALLNFALIGKQSLYLASNFVCTSKTESGWKANFRNYREYSSLSILIAVGRQRNRQCQFYQLLADSISARLMPESERPTIECVSTLLPTSWPSTVSSEYGQNELRLACSKFFFSPHTNDLKQDYRDFTDMNSAEVSEKN